MVIIVDILFYGVRDAVSSHRFQLLRQQIAANKSSQAAISIVKRMDIFQQIMENRNFEQYFAFVVVQKVQSLLCGRSTRKEISDILDELETKSKGKRFYGLVKKYNMLMVKEELPLNTCQDIRDIYDELALAEVAEENPENVPDGQFFRKDSVSVYSPTQKEIHKGLYPEEKIIQATEQALKPCWREFFSFSTEI